MTWIDKHTHRLVVLADPDKLEAERLDAWLERIRPLNPSIILVGGSYMDGGSTDALVRKLKQHIDWPVILFPGDFAQLTPAADAVLFLTLLSGRNPEYLAGQQVKAAPVIRQMQLPVIPTAYLLIDGGNMTTVQYITQTLPLPAGKPSLAVATALAGQYMGMEAVYLEAGSGALRPVPLETVEQVARAVDIPVIVGGGIKDLALVEDYFRAGANWVVVGTLLE